MQGVYLVLTCFGLALTVLRYVTADAYARLAASPHVCAQHGHLFRAKVLTINVSTEYGLIWRVSPGDPFRISPLLLVYAKKAFGGPDQVLEYLGRYSHKICISNFRILKITHTHVTFKYLDRKAKIQRTKTIKGADFIRLFAQHILLKGIVRIRHIGQLAYRVK